MIILAFLGLFSSFTLTAKSSPISFQPLPISWPQSAVQSQRLNYLHQNMPRILSACKDIKACTLAKKIAEEFRIIPPQLKFLPFEKDNKMCASTKPIVGSAIFINTNMLDECASSTIVAAETLFRALGKHYLSQYSEHQISDGIKTIVVHLESSIQSTPLSAESADRLLVFQDTNGFEDSELTGGKLEYNFPHLLLETKDTLSVSSFGNGIENSVTCPGTSPKLFAYWINRPSTSQESAHVQKLDRQTSFNLNGQIEYLCIDSTGVNGRRYFGQTQILVNSTLNKNYNGEVVLHFSEEIPFSFEVPFIKSVRAKTSVVQALNKIKFGGSTVIEFINSREFLGSFNDCKAYYSIQDSIDVKLSFESCRIRRLGQSKIKISVYSSFPKPVAKRALYLHSIELISAELKNPIPIYSPEFDIHQTPDSDTAPELSLTDFHLSTPAGDSSTKIIFPGDPIQLKFLVGSEVKILAGNIETVKTLRGNRKFETQSTFFPELIRDAILRYARQNIIMPNSENPKNIVTLDLQFPEGIPGITSLRLKSLRIIDNRLRTANVELPRDYIFFTGHTQMTLQGAD